MIDHKEYTIRTTDRIKLYSQTWSNGNIPRALVCLIHGLGDHSSRFDEWARLFVKQGFAVTAFDLRGNGKSEGKRGHASYEHLLNDIGLFVKESKKLFPKIPVILYGHSLGGALAINYTIKKQPKIAGLLTTSPWLKLYYQPAAYLLYAGKVLNHIAPSYTFKSGLTREDFNGTQVSDNVVTEDFLLHNRISVKLFFEANKYGNYALRNIYKINVPFLIIYGKDDKISSYKSCAEYVSNTGEKTKLKVFENCNHNMHIGENSLKVYKHILKWIEENCNIANTNKVKVNEFIPH